MKIDVEPAGVSFDIVEGETVMAAALRNGYTWPTICGGQGTCKTCVFLILHGQEHLSAMESREQAGLRAIADSLPNLGQGFRLACQTKVCQTKVSADIRLRKIGVRRQHGNG